MEGSRKRFSREFKLEAVRRSLESGKTASGVARELDIKPHMLYKWREEFDRSQENAFPGKGHKNPHNEIDRLRRENRRLKEERDILKKSLIFFAKDQANDSNSSGNSMENSQ